jgi:hypothetical protein
MPDQAEGTRRRATGGSYGRSAQPQLASKVEPNCLEEDVFFLNYQLFRNLSHLDLSRGDRPFLWLPRANELTWHEGTAFLRATFDQLKQGLCVDGGGRRRPIEVNGLRGSAFHCVLRFTWSRSVRSISFRLPLNTRCCGWTTRPSARDFRDRVVAPRSSSRRITMNGPGCP